MTPAEEAAREMGHGAEYDAGYAEGYPAGFAEGRAGVWPERHCLTVPFEALGPSPYFTLGRADGWFAGWTVGYAEGLT